MARTAEQIANEITAVVGGALSQSEVLQVAARVVQWELSRPSGAKIAPMFVPDLNGRMVELFGENTGDGTSTTPPIIYNTPPATRR